jgi:hypothetical protein
MTHGVDCMCGFTFRTPHGLDDAVATAQDHVRRVHRKEFPQGASREETLKLIKTY